MSDAAVPAQQIQIDVKPGYRVIQTVKGPRQIKIQTDEMKQQTKMRRQEAKKLKQEAAAIIASQNEKPKNNNEVEILTQKLDKLTQMLLQQETKEVIETQPIPPVQQTQQQQQEHVIKTIQRQHPRFVK
ncbi:Hypothetical_protein [Hexamita inflata]|uniref:Hypothetical_protein n=1 Tax=Hexamita inflata TaxID=28002 RepID=A0AA86QPE2_9EUKA|nr:Hypothetical protein HINF_LOCUS50991 [Hexamita inflata]